MCITRFNIKTFYVLPHRVYIHVLYLSEKKELVFMYTELTSQTV